MSESWQLKIDLDPAVENRFKNQLDAGKFTVLIEAPVPAGEIDQQSACEQLKQLEKAVLEVNDLPTGLAILDNHQPGRRRGAELATSLDASGCDRHVLYISGAGTNLRNAGELINIAANSGFRNLVPVSGSAAPHWDIRECRKQSFTESTTLLRMLQPGSFYCGCAVNPFGYKAYPLLGQYYKLIKKLQLGAGFIVTQGGWDMLKMQSLAWYLLSRDIYYPMISRLILLTPERVEKIASGKEPGIQISADFAKILSREMRYSKNQFESAQYRRLELQAAGCRLLGYSGVQISGADLPGKAQLVIHRIRQSLRDFPDFNTWLEEYNSYMASAEMAPFTRTFQLFDQYLSRDYPLNEPPVSCELGDPQIGNPEKLLLSTRKLMFSGASRTSPDHLRLLKLLFSGCRMCSSCRLPEREFVCPEHCPKRLADGPCGGVKPDGNCELGNFECIHSKIVRYAHYHGNLAKLENQMVKQAVSTPEG